MTQCTRNPTQYQCIQWVGQDPTTLPQRLQGGVSVDGSGNAFFGSSPIYSGWWFVQNDDGSWNVYDNITFAATFTTV